MSPTDTPPPTHGPRFTRRTGLLAAMALVASPILGACAQNPYARPSSSESRPTRPANSKPTPTPTSLAAPALALTAEHGTTATWPSDSLGMAFTNANPQKITVQDARGGVITGKLTGDTWKPDRTFLPNQTYTVTVDATTSAGAAVTLTDTFKTLVPKAAATWQFIYGYQNLGIGMPVYIQFDDPVTDPAARAAIQAHAHVTTTPAQTGSWGWVNHRTMQWRPKDYWLPGSTAAVNMQIGGISTAEGTYITTDGNFTYGYGKAHVLRVDLASQQMTVYDGGQLVKKIPVSTGKPGHDTYTGTKVIMEKLATMVMDSATFGVPATAAGGYRLTVHDAQRLTWDGEFIHDAPWSVADQGARPVSHGCTNVSDANGAWLFGFTQVGDPVEFTGGNLPYPPNEGIGVWAYSWADWQGLSALN